MNKISIFFLTLLTVLFIPACEKEQVSLEKKQMIRQIILDSGHYGCGVSNRRRSIVSIDPFLFSQGYSVYCKNGSHYEVKHITLDDGTGKNVGKWEVKRIANSG